MKRILITSGTFALLFLFLSSFSLRENPQDPPRGKKAEKHIQILKIDDDGNKTELDTIIGDSDVFVWNGDTITDDLNWLTTGDIDLDSLHKQINVDIEYNTSADENGNVFIMKSGKNIMPRVFKINTTGDSTKSYKIEVIADDMNGEHEVMVWNDDENEHKMMFNPKISGIPNLPPPPKVVVVDTKKNGNIINLSDSGIISFKKKSLSGGREKITIIRNEVDENELNEEIIVSGIGDHKVLPVPPQIHKIKVIKDGDASEEIIHLEGDEENIKVIKEDGKVIHIKEIKKGDKKEIEVEVEENN